MADNKAKNDSDAEMETSMPLPQVTEAQKELASQAMSEFDKKQYGSCCSLMHKLIAQRPTDPKVAHNKAVAEFYQSGFLTTDEFRQQLSKVCQMVCHEYFFGGRGGGGNVLFPSSFIKITGIRTSSFLLLHHEQQNYFWIFTAFVIPRMVDHSISFSLNT